MSSFRRLFGYWENTGMLIKTRLIGIVFLNFKIYLKAVLDV